jgi:hypothetical protein
MPLVREFRRFARSIRLAPALVLPALLAAGTAGALDHITLRRDAGPVKLEGRVVVEAADGGVLFETRDSALWIVQPEEQVERSDDDAPYLPLARSELAAAMLRELPPGFETHETKHYLICFNTSRAYAQWCGSLFERLYAGFTNYWSNRGFTPTEPEHPLVAFVFADRPTYARYAAAELGDRVDSIIGYYSLRTNRMTMYDLTGTAGTSAVRGSAAQITRTLAQPDAAKTVATIVHEATHQIAFNCGLHRRYADIPLWLSEGMAVFFETPDLGEGKGWRTIGDVNRVRLFTFAAYARRRPPDSLLSLLRENTRMQNSQTAVDAYAEAWALNYFLINARKEQYQAYLKTLAAKKPLVSTSPDERLAEFRAAFGDDIARLDREFLAYIGDKVKREMSAGKK